MFEARREHLTAVSRSWWRGAEPEAAEVPNWAEGSVGDRFFEGSRMKRYAVAPRLATAEIPSAEAFAADPGHWDIAVSALIRAVVLDRVPVTDPLVTKVIRLLGPAVDAEVRYAASGGRGSQPIGGVEGGFPEDDAPVFLLGACCLVDATWAVVGLDPLRDVLDYLGPRLDAALAELNCTPKPSGTMLAGTLLRAAADFYRLDEEPADAETMRAEMRARPRSDAASPTRTVTVKGIRPGLIAPMRGPGRGSGGRRPAAPSPGPDPAPAPSRPAGTAPCRCRRRRGRMRRAPGPGPAGPAPPAPRPALPAAAAARPAPAPAGRTARRQPPRAPHRRPREPRPVRPDLPFSSLDLVPVRLDLIDPHTVTSPNTCGCRRTSFAAIHRGGRNARSSRGDTSPPASCAALIRRSS